MRTMRFPRATTAVCLVAVIAALSACGSSGGNKSTAPTAPAATSTPASGDLKATYAAKLAPLLQRPTSIGITTPLNGPIPKGKTIYWLQCSSPACVVLTGYLKAAITTVGWKLVVVNAGITPETVKAAWDQAVQAKPDAVVASGFSRALFEPELKQLAALKIPVLDMTTADSPGNGLTEVLDYGPDYLAAGQRLATYAVAQAGGNINAVTISAAAFANLGYVAQGFTQGIKQACSSCSVASLDVPATSIGQDLPTRVATYLQAHPNVNWVYIGYADMMVGVPAALKSASITQTVNFVTIDSDPTTQSYIANGQNLAATDAFPKPELMWRHIDFLLRYFDHKSTAPSTAHTLPAWVVTKSNLPSTTTSFPLVPDYQAQYKKLWGLG